MVMVLRYSRRTTRSTWQCQLGSCAAAKAGTAPGVECRQHKGLNNRSEASRRHTRRREKIMGRFTSPGHAQRFLPDHDQAAALFRPKRHRLSAKSCRQARSDAFDLWDECTARLTP